MAQFQIPTKEKQYIQPNKSDLFGNLYGTFNIDFDSSQGKVRVAPRLRINTDSTDDADLGVPWAFVRSSADGTDRWWAGCGAVLFKTSNTDPTSVFTQDTITSSCTSLAFGVSDAVDFNGKLVISYSTGLDRLGTSTSVWTQNWWTGAGNLNQTALTASITHPLHVTTKTNLLLIGDGNLIHAVDKNNNVKNSRLILPAEFQTIWIRSTYDGTWIGARNKINKEAKAFFWDESAENYNRGYSLMSDMTFAGVIKNGVPYTVNDKGQLLYFTGTGFEEAAVFPVFGQINKRWNDGSAVQALIHQNGMSVIENQIHILLSSRINDDSAANLDNFPSGIYVYDEKQGLRHKYAFTLYDGTEFDYGCMSTVISPGALVPTTKSQGLFLAGGVVINDSASALYAIFHRDTNDSINKRGHFITSIFESSAFEDVFQDIALSFKRFRNSGDRIIIKYKSIKDPNYPITGTGTWTSTSVFITTANLTNALAGDEVMVINGKGSGATPEISSITTSAGTYTVILSEVVTGVSGTLRFLIDDWTKCATISTQGIERESFDLDVLGTFIQLKVELRSAPAGTAGAGDSPELEKIIVTTQGESVI